MTAIIRQRGPMFFASSTYHYHLVGHDCLKLHELKREHLPNLVIEISVIEEKRVYVKRKVPA